MNTYRAAKQALLAQSEAATQTPVVRRLLKSLTQLTDEALGQLWAVHIQDPRLVLVAVGGYGRGELFPYSDVDVLLLMPDEADVTALQTQIESFISACWDAGLEIGSSVRQLSECTKQAKADITIQTALLEARLLVGQANLFKKFKTAFDAQLDSRAFMTAKVLEMEQRHHKFEDTPYALEPNCKESPGGLRDLQILLWIAKAAGLGQTWSDLVRNRLATAREVQHILRNEAILSGIRIELHRVAHRREDRLVFDLQTAVALRFGFQFESSRKASEALMQRYYWAAKAVVQLNQVLLLNFKQRLDPHPASAVSIDEDFSDLAGLLDIKDERLYQKKPSAILQTFLCFQKMSGIYGLSAKTLRALYNARALMNADFRRDPINRATFMAILQQPEGITHAMRLMNQTSVLGRYLWAFRRIVGQMQHDLFHVYTVDQHILMVLRNIRRFFIADHAHEYPFCSTLAAGWDKPWVLYIAALFHDIAKGRGGDHSELGIAEVQRFCKQHAIEKEDSKLAAFLVKEHLTMSTVAQKQDLSDPDVIAKFAARVGNERKLTALYLLTVADIRGTSPKVWNAWKGKLLEDLYQLTLNQLGGRAPDASALVEITKREASSAVALYGYNPHAQDALWRSLDVSYFMRSDAADIAWHTRQLIAHAGSSKPIVRARLSPIGEGLQVLVYTPDAADLFARICGFFEKNNFSIQDAKIHTTRDGHALDSFQVNSVTLAASHRELIHLIEAELTRELQQQGALPSAGQSRISRRVKSFPMPARIELRPDEKAQRWLLNIAATDRLGLLYAMACVLAKHNINLQLAKICTLGERIEDSFVIDGAALQHNKTQLALETDLLAALDCR